MFILLLFYYWLLVSVSKAIIRPIFTKNLKMLVHIVKKLNFIDPIYIH